MRRNGALLLFLLKLVPVAVVVVVVVAVVHFSCCFCCFRVRVFVCSFFLYVFPSACPSFVQLPQSSPFRSNRL